MVFTDTLGSVHTYWLGGKSFWFVPPSLHSVSLLPLTLLQRFNDISSNTAYHFSTFELSICSSFCLEFLSSLSSSRSSKLCQKSFNLSPSLPLSFFLIIINKSKSLPVLYCHINWINIYLCTHCTILHLFICIYPFYLIVSCENREGKIAFSIDTKYTINICDEFSSLSKQGGTHGMMWLICQLTIKRINSKGLANAYYPHTHFILSMKIYFRKDN